MPGLNGVKKGLFAFDFSPLFSFAVFGRFVISAVCFPFPLYTLRSLIRDKSKIHLVYSHTLVISFILTIHRLRY